MVAKRKEIAKSPFIAESSGATHRRRIAREKRGIASSTRPMARNRRGTCPQSRIGCCLNGPHVQPCRSGAFAHPGSAERGERKEHEEERERKKETAKWTPVPHVSE